MENNSSQITPSELPRNDKFTVTINDCAGIYKLVQAAQNGRRDRIALSETPLTRVVEEHTYPTSLFRNESTGIFRYSDKALPAFAGRFEVQTSITLADGDTFSRYHDGTRFTDIPKGTARVLAIGPVLDAMRQSGFEVTIDEDSNPFLTAAPPEEVDLVPEWPNYQVLYFKKGQTGIKIKFPQADTPSEAVDASDELDWLEAFREHYLDLQLVDADSIPTRAVVPPKFTTQEEFEQHLKIYAECYENLITALAQDHWNKNSGLPTNTVTLKPPDIPKTLTINDTIHVDMPKSTPNPFSSALPKKVNSA